MQIDADLVKKSIKDSSLVIIMAHRNLDLDALGASLGVYYLCKTLGKNACLLIEDLTSEDGVARSLKEINRQKINIKVKKWIEIKDKIDDKTLLIITDTHIASLVQNKEALKISNTIIIDHHIQSDDNTIKSTYEYIGEQQSSSVEIVIELLKNLDIYIHPFVATIMLAGIFIDTDGFFRKTGFKTHDAASYLYQSGAMLNELQYLLKEDAQKFNDMQQIIGEAQIIDDHFIIAIGHNYHMYSKVDLAKISDAMLLFKNIEASFTIGKIDNETIGISARSLGNIDVERIMEKLNGGGHSSDAATQLKGATLESALEDLKKSINDLEGGLL